MIKEKCYIGVWGSFSVTYEEKIYANIIDSIEMLNDECLCITYDINKHNFDSEFIVYNKLYIFNPVNLVINSKRITIKEATKIVYEHYRKEGEKEHLTKVNVERQGNKEYVYYDRIGDGIERNCDVNIPALEIIDADAVDIVDNKFIDKKEKNKSNRYYLISSILLIILILYLMLIR